MTAPDNRGSVAFRLEANEVQEFDRDDHDDHDDTVEVKKPKSILFVLVEYFKYFYSMVLLIFCVTMVMGCIFTGQSAAANYNIPSWGAFIIFWFLICWLALMEGGQGCLVGLQPVEKTLYSDSHPKTLRNTGLAHKDNNMERFIIGRQFLCVLVIFLINICGSATENAAPFPSLPQGFNSVFLANGVALMITTIAIGQLPSQVNGAVSMLDFINNYFMLATIYLSLAIEASGLLHCVYLTERLFSMLAGTKCERGDESIFVKLLFWARVMMSLAVLTFALAVTMKALINNQSGMWEGVPVWLSIIIFFLLLCLVGFMEGMQIAAFSLVNMPEWELDSKPIVKKNCEIMFSGQNLQSFLIGRQIFVATLMFIVAKIATISIGEGEKNIFGVPDGFQSFLDTGLLGAIVLTILGSLAWRIIASNFPVAFMSNPLIYVIIRICLFLESIGICAAAWILARFHMKIAGFKPDDDHLDMEEEIEEVKPAMRSSLSRSSIAVSKVTENRLNRLNSIKIGNNTNGNNRSTFIPLLASVRIDKPNFLGFDDEEGDVNPLVSRLSVVGTSFRR